MNIPLGVTSPRPRHVTPGSPQEYLCQLDAEGVPYQVRINDGVHIWDVLGHADWLKVRRSDRPTDPITWVSWACINTLKVTLL